MYSKKDFNDDVQPNGKDVRRESYGHGGISVEQAAAGVVDVDAKATTYVVLACIVSPRLLPPFRIGSGISQVRPLSFQ